MDDRHYMWVSQGSQGSLGEMQSRLFSVRARTVGYRAGEGVLGTSEMRYHMDPRDCFLEEANTYQHLHGLGALNMLMTVTVFYFMAIF